MTSRYVIIGSGVAGLAAALAIREADGTGQITMVSDDPHGYYSRPGLAYLLTGEIPQGQLFPWQQTDWRRLALERITGEVVQLALESHQVVLADGSRLPYDRLLLATGSSAVPLQVPGSDLPQVVKLDSLADAQRILKLARRARAAVVVGGGITALEIVEGLRPHCRHVHYLLRGDRYWSNVLDEAESQIVLDQLAEEGVQIHPRTEIAEITSSRGRVSGVRTAAGEHIPCDLVAAAIGVRPQDRLARAAGLEVDRGILVDETLRTSAVDVYAAGDVAQVHDPSTGKALLDTLWNLARSQGTIAGQNMAGGNQRYVKPMPLNVTRLAGITTTIIGRVGHGRDADVMGIARGDSETWRHLDEALVVEDASEINRLRLVMGSNTLIGAIVMGDQRPSRPLQRLIGEQIDITPIRGRLQEPQAPLAAVLAQFAGM